MKNQAKNLIKTNNKTVTKLSILMKKGKTGEQIKDKENNSYANEQTNNNKNYIFKKIELVY